MDAVNVTPGYEVPLPRRVRDALGIAPGQPMQALVDGSRIDLVPLPPLATMRGLLAGIDTRVERARDRL